MRFFRLTILLAVVALMACGGKQKTDDGSAAADREPAADEAPEGEKASDDDLAEEDASEYTDPGVQEPVTADPNAPANVAAPPGDAQVTESGLAYTILTEGEGEATPSETSVVKVHYTGWTTDGVKFDSSRDRGEPAEFPLDKVIAGWTEGVSMMKVGETRRLWIPEGLAYKGSPGKPQGMLVFDVELLEIVQE